MINKKKCTLTLALFFLSRESLIKNRVESSRVVLATFSAFSIIVTLKLRCLSKGTSSGVQLQVISSGNHPIFRLLASILTFFLLVSFVFFSLLGVFLLSLGLRKSNDSFSFSICTKWFQKYCRFFYSIFIKNLFVEILAHILLFYYCTEK